ncbi:hypothetical protein BH20ACT9_BH20ACT9_03550 [soil metagenome]
MDPIGAYMIATLRGEELRAEARRARRGAVARPRLPRVMGSRALLAAVMAAVRPSRASASACCA